MKATLTKCVLAVALCFSLSGCFGAFNATRVVWDLNNQVSDRMIVKELVFLTSLPAYIIAPVLDMFVFNWAEWLTGENPIDPENPPSRPLK